MDGKKGCVVCWSSTCMPRTARTRQMVEDRTQNLPGCSSLSNCWPVTTWRDRAAVDTEWRNTYNSCLQLKLKQAC